MNILNLKNYVFGDDIQAICKPLKDHFGIHSLVYHKLYDDGSEIKLGTNPLWLEHFLKYNLFQHSTFEHHPSLYQSGYVLWSQLKTHSKVLSDARKQFGIANGITFIKKFDGGCEFFFFGTAPANNNMGHFYLNNIDILENFIRYFKQKAAPLMQRAEKNKIVIPNRFAIDKPKDKAIFTIKDETSRREFLQNLKTELGTINTRFGEIKLSKREIDCAEQLVQGKTGREIALALSISDRTVETHLLHLKEKLNTRTKSELIAKLLQSGFAATL